MKTTNALKQIAQADLENGPFILKIQAEIYEQGLNSRRVALMAGIDYPSFLNMINHPDRYPISDGCLVKLAKIPFLREMIAKERLDRVCQAHDPADVHKALQELVKENPEWQVHL